MVMTITPERVAELREKHAACATERERAEYEAFVMIEVRRENAGEKNQNVLLSLGAELLGISIYQLRTRRQLSTYGELAEPLWPLIEGDMTFATAIDIVRKAKDLRVPPEPTVNVVKRVIAEYYARPMTKVLEGGKILRLDPHGDERGPAQVSEAEPAEPASEPPARKQPAPQQHGTDAVFAQVRDMCLEYARGKLPEHDDEAVEDAVRRLETDLKIALEQFSDRVRRMRGKEPLRVVLNRRQVTDACRTLILDPPEDIRHVSDKWKQQARRQFKNLAREFHPDSHGGSQATRPRYEAIVAAWNVLQQLIDPK